MRRRREGGGVLLETVMVAPVLLGLLVGMISLGQIIYTYVALEKIMYNLARYVGTQQGVNFCDPNDPTVQAAENLAVFGNVDGTGNAIVGGLTTGMITLSVERYSPASQTLGPCDCSVTGCDAGSGGLPPDFIVASLPNGYPIQPLFFGFRVDPILLKPHVRVPYGGT
jgi:hypothetical protein